MNGNLKLNKNAPRDKNGKCKEGFAQHFHSSKQLSRKIGGTVGYLIYSFMLDNVGGEFKFTIKSFQANFEDANFSESRISRALNKLINAGLIIRKRLPSKGMQAQYQYQLNEISTKTQLDVTEINKQPKQNTAAFKCENKLIDDDFTADEIEEAINAGKQGMTTTRQMTKTGPPNEKQQHIIEICKNASVYDRAEQEKVISSCREYYREHQSFPNDDLITEYANNIPKNYTLTEKSFHQQSANFR